MNRKDRGFGFKINPQTNQLEFRTRKGIITQNSIKTFLIRLAQKAHPDRTFAATYEEMADLLPNYYSNYVNCTGMNRVIRGLIQLRFIERRMVSGKGYQYFLTDKTYEFINQHPRRAQLSAQNTNQEALTSNIDNTMEDIISKVQQVLAENATLKNTVEQQSVKIAELEQQAFRTPSKVHELKDLLSMNVSA